MKKRSVPQSVFDSKEAIRIAREANREAVEELNRTPVHLLGLGNPNHPIYDGIFGYETKEFLKKQY